MSIQRGKRTLAHLLVDVPSLCSVRDNHHCQRAIIRVGIHSIKHRLENYGSGFLRVWNMNTSRPQPMESTRDIVVRLSPVFVSESCLLAQVISSLECTKLGAFNASTVQAVLAFLGDEIHLLDLLLLESQMPRHQTRP